MVIAANIEATSFGWKPIESLGLSSYSVYLYHWPCYVALKMLHLASRPAWVVGAILFSLLLGYASYHMIEKPARRWLQSMTWRGFTRVSIGWLALAGCTAVIVKLDGLPQRRPDLASVLEEFKSAEVDSSFPSQCVNWQVGNNLKLCKLHPGASAAKAWLVIGDSHAQHYWPYFDSRSKDQPVDFLTSAGCPPLPGVNRVEVGYSCPSAMERAQELVLSGRYERVIVAASWDGYFSAKTPLCSWENGRCNTSLDSPESARDIVKRAEWRWRDWVRRGVQVDIALPEPTLDFNLPREMARRTYLGLNLASAESIDVQDYLNRAGRLRSLLERAANHARATVIDPAAQLCHSTECRFVDERNEPILRDSNHLRSSWVAKAMHYPDALLGSPR